MARTEATRPDHARACRRYASDLTDRERSLIKPFMHLVHPPRQLGHGATDTEGVGGSVGGVNDFLNI